VFGLERAFLSCKMVLSDGVSPVKFRRGVESVMGIDAVAFQQGERGR